MEEFIGAFALVFMAEMGDKSQLLALAFATRYPLRWVLSGVSLGILLNHGLAIVFALLLSAAFGGLGAIQFFAAILFIFFGFKSFLLDFGPEEEEVKDSKLGPIFTMAATFFMGELGDKTQLTAMTLALDSQRPWLIFVATVSSMILVSSIGIGVGKVLGKKIPQVTMSYIGGLLFLYFGLSKLWDLAPLAYKKVPFLALAIIVILLVVGILLELNKKRRDRYYSAALYQSMEKCKHCQRHNPNCPTALEINRLTKEYLGEDIPFIGDIIGHLESIKGFDSKKYESLQDKYRK